MTGEPPPDGDGGAKLSGLNLFALGLSLILAALFIYYVVISVVEWAVRTVGGVAWWPLGADGTAALTLGFMLSVLWGMGVRPHLAPASKSQSRAGDGEPHHGEVILRAFGTVMFHLISILLAIIILLMTVEAVR